MDAASEHTAVIKLCICCHKEFTSGQVLCPDDGTALVPLKTDGLVGTIFDDKYEILGVIGGGGMGTVYRARHRLMKRLVAIKVLHDTQMGCGNAIKRFQVEAQAASALTMANITTIFDFGHSPQQQPYMVMDYLDGRSLKEHVHTDGGLPIPRAVHIFIQISKALAHAHKKGVIHRDVKPSNIVLVRVDNDNDFVKLVDFGIAKVLSQFDSESENLTQPGEVFGSGNYMSPEQCRGQKLDARSDMYSLGAVMYFTLAGRTVFEDSDILSLMYKHMTELPDSLQSVRADVPAELESIVLKALAKDPDDRYQSMDELCLQLEKFEASINLNAPPPVKTGDTLMTPPPTQKSSSKISSKNFAGEEKTLPALSFPKTTADKTDRNKIQKKLLVALALAALGLTAGLALVGRLYPSAAPAVNQTAVTKAPVSETAEQSIRPAEQSQQDEIPVVLPVTPAQSVNDLPTEAPGLRKSHHQTMAQSAPGYQQKRLANQNHQKSSATTNKKGFSRFKNAIKHFFQKLD